jgi:acyl phosphate:glycerol-3-phosphate acyltransferase
MTQMVIAGLVLGYALGAVPFGLILGYLSGAGDIRKIGSGNIGATNVLRTGRKGLAGATLLLDAAKGATAVLVMAHIGGAPATGWASDAALAAAVGALLGHCFPVWLGFRGGKGVATLLGVCLALAWPVGLVCVAVWLIVLKVGRISSVSGMSAALAAPVTASVIGQGPMACVLAGLAVVVLWQHRANIARLRQGTEPRVGSSARAGLTES